MQSTTNSATSHYREHTRQQDGWTVLATPPAPELPPPYAPVDANSTPAGPVAATPTLPFQILTNSNIIAAVPVSVTRRYARGVPFAVAFPEICTTMKISSLRACIGFKWDNDKVNAPVHQLSNAVDWENCVDSGLKMQARVRTRTVCCIIKNLNLPEETAPTSSATITTSVKRKALANSTSAAADGKMTFDYTPEYRQLKKSLDCAMHKGKLCFVSNVDGHHIEVDCEHASLWAKDISMGNTSYSQPPGNIMFQDYFLPVPKRRNARTGDRYESSTNPCAPTIHVTVNTGASTSGTNTDVNRMSATPPRPPRRSPLSTITAATANANNVPSSLYRGQPDADIYASGSHDVSYPTVTEVLQLIDDSGVFADSGLLDFPVVIFADDLERSQITHVDHVPLLETAFYVDVVNMPAALAELFVDESIAAMGRAQKGKGRMTQKGRM
ncbi:hypothetical protein B0H16DRAFT_1470236 [Mycena metata]|uniref:Uncharacterized protein n=1 Tax=Mycena metata TaxID=1033252 RepID=A0AAD7MQW7_9AGAR|nr:hypothetical protein B0H16DRAFT_1470236 [Mycena metata]